MPPRDLKPRTKGFSLKVVEEVCSATLTRRYTYGINLISQSQTVNGSWVTSFYEYDGQGDVRQLTDSSGSVTDTYSYDAFGNSIERTGTTPNNFLYNGEQYDPDLGFYYFRARYYNPQTGRFMSQDPFEGFAEEPLSVNKYLYAYADPINLFDPSGRQAMIEYSRTSEESVKRTPELKEIEKETECNINKGGTAVQSVAQVISTFDGSPVQLEVEYSRCRTTVRKHHSCPKFLGGNPSQTINIPSDMHGQLHRDLYNFLKKSINGKSFEGRGKTAIWILDNIAGGSQSALDKSLAKFYIKYFSKYPKPALQCLTQLLYKYLF